MYTICTTTSYSTKVLLYTIKRINLIHNIFMHNTLTKPILTILACVMALGSSPAPVAAESLIDLNTGIEVDANIDITAADIGAASEAQVNAAATESTETETVSGTLIEIGNTTAAQTTIVVRTTDDEGESEDVTLEVDTATSLQTDTGTTADLSDWIAGDPVTFTARHYTNSGQLLATRIRNRAFKRSHKGINGWVKAVRAVDNEMDIEWGKQIYTLSTTNTKMVAGVKNPATLADFKIGDRIRTRVSDDGDQNPATWNANIIVVLRRGNTLFMRVTRWVVAGKITMLPESTSVPTTIELEVLRSKFYEEGDVNNLIGAPGTKLLVDITNDTKLVRRYLGKALLAEFSEGDEVRIIGRLNESNGHLTAKFIKNNSIQKLGVAYRMGEVMAIDAAAKSFAVKLLSRTPRNDMEWTIKTNADTKFHKNGNEATFADVQIGSKVRVRGLANRLLKTVDADVVAIVRSQ